MRILSSWQREEVSRPALAGLQIVAHPFVLSSLRRPSDYPCHPCGSRGLPQSRYPTTESSEPSRRRSVVRPTHKVRPEIDNVAIRADLIFAGTRQDIMSDP